MDDLQRRQMDRAHEIISATRSALGLRGGYKPLELSDEDFDALVHYRSALAHRRSQLEHALKQALEEVKTHEREVNNLMGPPMVGYTRSALKGKKKRQVPTTSGVVQVRKMPDRFFVSEEKLAKAWLKKNMPGALRCSASLKSLSAAQQAELRGMVEEGIIKKDQLKMEDSIDVPKVRAYMKETGEIPPGFDLTIGGDRLYIKEGTQSEVIGSDEVDEDLLHLQTAEVIAGATDEAGKDAGSVHATTRDAPLSPALEELGEALREREGEH